MFQIAFMKHYKDQEFINKVCARIKEIRETKNITQEILVERTGFDLRQIGRILRGETNTSLSSIAQLSRALGVHPKELFDFDFDLNPDFIKPVKG